MHTTHHGGDSCDASIGQIPSRDTCHLTEALVLSPSRLTGLSANQPDGHNAQPSPAVLSAIIADINTARVDDLYFHDKLSALMSVPLSFGIKPRDFGAYLFSVWTVVHSHQFVQKITFMNFCSSH